ncbi:hypothetical protein [Gracilibacillus thailandensis]|uniref:Uncharacterized protein n=1 Tax=Gracilibacillus thailandensis TaxID=563735 RepID=A0A6N7QSC6_9BACI|nr:hypothetical protein [Gracilibacillus thailandensis]MRI64933.1 hypothetical protein [Gracilibacillus thailandensis]
MEIDYHVDQTEKLILIIMLALSKTHSGRFASILVETVLPEDPLFQAVFAWKS